MKWLKLRLWHLRYSIEFGRLTGWSFFESWRYGDSTLENFNYDLEDVGCPIDAVSEDLSCWSD